MLKGDFAMHGKKALFRIVPNQTIGENVKIDIKSRFNDFVLFSHEAEENTLKITMLMALKAGANLFGANLREANLFVRALNNHESLISALDGFYELVSRIGGILDNDYHLVTNAAEALEKARS